jgi:hypothetical protein
METKKTKKWQIPLLLLGFSLLAFFGLKGIQDFRSAGGAGRPAATAKAPERVKTRAPVPDEAESAKPPTPSVRPAPTLADATPAQQLALLELPAGDVLRPLDTRGESAADELLEGAGPPEPGMAAPEIPPAMLVAAREPPEAALPAAGGAAARIRKRGSGFPGILPERVTREESIQCVGTITGKRRVAVLRDLSASNGTPTLFVAEGERIPGRSRLVVGDIQPGSVTIKTSLAATTLPVRPEEETGAGGAENTARARSWR